MNRSFLLLMAAMGTAIHVPAADFVTGQAARLVIGQTNFTEGAVGTSDTQLGAPTGLAFVNDQLFVADSNRLGATPVNNRVLIYSNASQQFPAPTDYLNPTGGLSITCPACVGRANLVVGQNDFTSNGISLTQNGFRTPTGIATDGKILVVADSDNNRILIWNNIPTSNGTPADVVIGQPDFTHAGTASPPTAKSLRGPQAVWLQNGKLFVADTQDNRVLIYNSIPTANNAAADVVLGQANFTTEVVPDITKINIDPTSSNLTSPVHVSSDGTRLLVTDLGHNRVLIWNTIPTSNNQPADLVIGQPDMTSQAVNNSAKLCPALTTTSTTSTTPVYPQRCAATLSFPRAAIIGGGRLFIADGGNDRVLVFSQIPAASAPSADVVLGQADSTSNNSSSATDALATPTALAWDGVQNLFVSDTFNRRILIYSPGENGIALNGIRNAASLEIFATGQIGLGGTVTTGDVVTLTIASKTYAYTTVANDTLAIITSKLTGLVNAGSGDPNVLAIPNTATNTIVLTARKGGDAGVGTTYGITTNTGSKITSASAGTSTAINLASATQIAPGSLITILGNNLSDNTAVANFADPSGYLPFDLGGVTVYIDGLRANLLYASPNQINTQMYFELHERSSVSVYARIVHNDGTVTATVPVGVHVVQANPGIFAQPGSEPRVGLVYHASGYATALVSVDGTVTAGNTVTLNIGSNSYSYTAVAGDTTASVRDALIAKINATDPNVTASAPNEFARILLTAKTPGAAGGGTAVSATVTSGSTLVVTALTSSLCCAGAQGLPVDANNPAAPGETLFTYATGLGILNPWVANLTGNIYPATSNGPANPVDSILAGGKSANIVGATLVPGLPGVWQVTFQISNALTPDPLTQLTLAQGLFVSNVVTFPVATP